MIATGGVSSMMMNLCTVLSLLLLCSVSAIKAQCPAPEPCRCTETPNPTTGHTMHVIDCNDKNLSAFPAFSLWQGEPWDQVLLSNNQLTSIPDFAFRPLNNIKAIDLSHNKLTDIPENAIEGLKYPVASLLLVENSLNISELPWTALTPLHQLTLLNLDGNYNDYHVLNSNAFINLPELEYLTLSRCALHAVENGAFNGSAHIRELDFYGNDLHNIPDALQALPNLEVLNFDSNQILEIHAGAFMNNTALRSLTLSRNNLANTSAIHPEAFVGCGKSLKLLNFYYCSLKEVPSKAFTPLQNLENLDISYNQIERIESAELGILPKLTQLSLSGNPLELTVDTFTGVADTLNYILIRKMNYTSLPLESLEVLKALNWIDASSNPFKELNSGSFPAVPNFNRISIMWTNLTTIASDTFNQFGTKGEFIIDFDQDNITDVSFINKASIRAFKWISIPQNPVNCTCELWQTLTNSLTMPEITGTCGLPPKYANMTIANEFIQKAKHDCL